MRVGLLLKLHKPEALELARELLALLDERGVDRCVVGAPAGSLPDAVVGGDAELRRCGLVVVLGGDGTLLHAAEIVADEGVPILGVNLGNLGFLTSFSKGEARAGLAEALDGKLGLERRMRLRVRLRREDGVETVRYACNDAVISQGGVARLLEFEAHLDGQEISTYRADGLIIGTPTGSTAYNLAAGGPIMSPEVQGMVLTPICPHTLTNRPLVVPADARLTIRLGEAARNVILTVDGQGVAELAYGDVVEVHAAERPLLLCRPTGTSYFDILRAKLHWGERAGHRHMLDGPEVAALREATSPLPRR